MVVVESGEDMTVSWVGAVGTAEGMFSTSTAVGRDSCRVFVIVRVQVTSASAQSVELVSAPGADSNGADGMAIVTKLVAVDVTMTSSLDSMLLIADAIASMLVTTVGSTVTVDGVSQTTATLVGGAPRSQVVDPEMTANGKMPLIPLETDGVTYDVVTT
jgi:hypothetical protein